MKSRQRYHRWRSRQTLSLLAFLSPPLASPFLSPFSSLSRSLFFTLLPFLAPFFPSLLPRFFRSPCSSRLCALLGSFCMRLRSFYLCMSRHTQGWGDWGRSAFPVSPAPVCAARLLLSHAPRPLRLCVSPSLSVIPLWLRAGAISQTISFLGHYCIFVPASRVVSVFSFLFKKVLRFRLSPLSARQSWSLQSASINRMRGGEKRENYTKYRI